MSAPNFTKVNAHSYYVVSDTTTYLDENDVEKQCMKDEVDYDMDIDNLKVLGQNRGFHSYDKNNYDDYNCNLDSFPLLYKYKGFQYGKDEYINSFNIEGRIYAIGGRYAGMNYDWDLIFQLNSGDNFYLSDYEDEEAMLNDIMEGWEYIALNYTDNWNAGLVKIYKDKVRKFIEDKIDICSTEYDNLCKDACDMILECTGIFSNGEAVYQKVEKN